MSVPAAAYDVVALGESMITFRPAEGGASDGTSDRASDGAAGLADAASFTRGIGGAESNVACVLAAAGHRTAWVSRVGADGFGAYLTGRIAAYGVDTSHVRRDPHRPTGIYFRTAGERALGAESPAADEHTPAAAPPASGEPARPAAPPAADGRVAEVVYYRAGSAASAMSPANTPADVLRSGRVLHLTGITAALSPDCRALLDDLTTHPAGHPAGHLPTHPAGHRAAHRAAPPGAPPAQRPAPAPADGHRPLLSFDVNHRTGLWQTGGSQGQADPGAVLRRLADRCDVVFTGTDEAAAVWPVAPGPDPAAIRAVLPGPATLVVKQGAGAVTVLHRPGPPGTPDTVTTVPALHVDVVAPVGAGDAFAAGYLSGTLRGLPVRERIRHGHLMAAAALTVPGDLAPPPPRALADRLAALDDDTWAALHLTPGWTARTPLPQEVTAP